MNKLNLGAVRESAKYYPSESISQMQTAVYVMCGGGLLGKTAAESPANFYIDSRVSRLPYPKKQILQAVAVLVVFAEVHGLDAKHLPPVTQFHNMGVF